jgi:predicted flavoprotein YhiN
MKHIKDNDKTIVKKMALHIAQFETKIIATNSFEQAQVCSGGVDTNEINPKTMESLLVKNLYFAGEILDVDGVCGGYNLQWAWSSGYVAGSSLKGTNKWA